MKQKSNVAFTLALAFSLAALSDSYTNEAGTGEPEQGETNESSQSNRPVETPSIEPAPHETPSDPGEIPSAKEAPHGTPDDPGETPPAEKAPYETGTPAPPTSVGDAPNATVRGAMNQPETLPAKGRVPETGHARPQLGERWKDIGRNSCDTEDNILS